MINLLILVNHPNLYGSNRSILMTVKGLDRTKINPIFVCGGSGPFTEELQKLELKYYTLKHFYSVYPNLTRGNKLLKALLFFPKFIIQRSVNLVALIRVISIILRNRIDLVHTNVGPIHIGFYASILTRRKHIWHLREYQKLDFSMNPIPSMSMFRNLAGLSRTVAISKGIYQYFQLKDNTATIIFDGVLSKDESILEKNKESYFLFVGRLDATKGILKLVESFGRFSKINKTFKLKIAGDGRDSQKVRNLIRQLDLLDRVEMLGFQENIKPLLSKAYAIVVCSKSEAFGRVSVEAMFYGCPVVGLDVAGTREIIKPDNIGCLFKSFQELEQKLVELIEMDKKKYEELIVRAQQHAITHFTCEKNSDEMQKLYQLVFDGDGNQAGAL